MSVSPTQAISDLILTYAERLDIGDFDAVAQLFERASLRSSSSDAVRRGSSEVLELYRGSVVLYDGIPSTKHVTTNLMIDVAENGRSATARSYFTVLQARPQLPLQTIIAGRYHDSFAGGPQDWHFRDRLILVDLVGDLRFHLKANSLNPTGR